MLERMPSRFAFDGGRGEGARYAVVFCRLHTMPRLTVILKHGFEGDRAVVKVNGETALDRSDLTTKTTVDRATAFDRDVEGGEVRVEIEIPTRRLSKSIRFEITDQKTVLVNIVNGSQVQTEIVDGVVGDA
jgi:hypothetical protein